MNLCKPSLNDPGPQHRWTADGVISDAMHTVHILSLMQEKLIRKRLWTANNRNCACVSGTSAHVGSVASTFFSATQDQKSLGCASHKPGLRLQSHGKEESSFTPICTCTRRCSHTFAYFRSNHKFIKAPVSNFIRKVALCCFPPRRFGSGEQDFASATCSRESALMRTQFLATNIFRANVCTKSS